MPGEAVMAWIEDGTGTIARGHVDSASASGACIRLADRPGFGAGDEVAVRICFEIGAPTVAVAARVSSVRAGGEVVLCDLQWTAIEEGAFDDGPAHAA